MKTDNTETIEKTNFIRDMIRKDLAEGKHQEIQTRFPPEPNGYLHIGHAKSICLNFGLARDFKGKCNLRFDDTNPEVEKQEYIDAIKEDVQWLGFQWSGEEKYSSDYFQKYYDLAVLLIKKGLAYVCDLTPEQTKEYRGDFNTPGKNSPFRDRSVEENLKLFEGMKNGDFAEGSCVLRAKIDMQSPNMNMRDPLIYRIKKVEHPKTGNTWCIYPMYDYAHGLGDSFEGVTHSLCTLEFEDHRPLYDWFLKECEVEHISEQTEFSRLNLDYTVMSKRKLLQLVNEKYVDGWDDPRMLTIRGIRRRGYTPKAIRNFCDQIGITKKLNLITMSTLESAVREDLDDIALRVMAVLDPIKITITNFPDNEVEMMQSQNHPKKEELGMRDIPFTKEIYIDRDDFMEEPPKGFHRLIPGGKVRLRFAYVINCDEVIKDESGKVIELKCSYDDRTRAGHTPEGEKKVKGIIHWVSATRNKTAEVRLYDRLFNDPNPDSHSDGFLACLNPDSKKIIPKVYIEENIEADQAGVPYQFERLGFFTTDWDSTKEKMVFNKTVSLKDTWAKIQKK